MSMHRKAADVSDYGKPLRFGHFLTPDASMGRRIISFAQELETLELDLIGIQDHPYQARFFDTLTLCAMIAAQTSRIRIFPDVMNLPLRQPAVLAKAAATIDQLSGGRFELGLGAGAFWDAIAAMGGPKRTPGEALAAFEEALSVIRLMWSNQRSAFFNGEHYRLRGVHPGPQPAHPMQIWVGATGPKMMDLIGRVGDGWVPSLAYVPPDRILELRQRIDDAAAQAGRDPAAIERILNIHGQITDGSSTGLLVGPVARWVDDLTALTVDYGMNAYILMGNDLDQVRRFANEVVPQVREQVARHRASA